MIKSVEKLSLVETKKVLGSIENEKKKDVEGYIKKFNKLKLEQAKKIREEIEKLENLKIKQEHIVKMIDLVPEDASDLNKIFSDVSLDENETNQILEIIKKNK